TAVASLSLGLLIATVVDVATDGFIIGAGFAAGGSTGTVLAIGLSVELLFLGMALASEATQGWRIVAISGALGATVWVFALLGSYLLAGASTALIAGALAFSAAALLYLVTDELLVEAHEVEEKPISTLVLFAGFLAFWTIQLFGV
ncbi:MAG: transporter, partial [Gallionella sp.]